MRHSNKPPKLPRQIPRYLQNINSKIKPDVQKDIGTYKLLTENYQENSIEKDSLSLIDLTDKTQFHKENLSIFDKDGSKPNFFYMDIENKGSVDANISVLEGTFTDQSIKKRSKISESYLEKVIETPRYPTEIKKDQQENGVLDIAENFLSGPLMAELCNMSLNISTEEKCLKSQQVPPLDLLSYDENIVPFRQRWEEATKDIGKKVKTLKPKNIKITLLLGSSIA